MYIYDILYIHKYLYIVKCTMLSQRPAYSVFHQILFCGNGPSIR